MIEMETTRRGFARTMAVGAAALAALNLGGASGNADAIEPSVTDGVVASDQDESAARDAILSAAPQLADQKPRKIAVLLGSGQDADEGNTAKLVSEFARGATEMGHEVEVFLLGKMDVHPCIGCGHCRQSEERTCVFDDDMTKVYDAYFNCDMLVFATPMRYWMVAGALKNAIDRLYRVADGNNFDTLPHDWHESYRQLDTVLLCSSADTGWYTYNWLREWYHTCLCNFFGFRDRGHLFVGGCGENSWGANEEMHRQGSSKHIEDTGGLEAAYQFGREVYADEPVYRQLQDASIWNMQK